MLPAKKKCIILEPEQLKEVISEYISEVDEMEIEDEHTQSMVEINFKVWFKEIPDKEKLEKYGISGDLLGGKILRLSLAELSGLLNKIFSTNFREAYLSFAYNPEIILVE